ncbi:hypothetical protein [Azospirillum sp.]|uniref:hypothetical protein n=1 Tax=Azospirillum sp. TaxID=34012 RepID=UPI003D711564
MAQTLMPSSDLTNRRDGVVCPSCQHGMTDRETCQWCGFPHQAESAAATGRAVRLLESYAAARKAADSGIGELVNHFPGVVEEHSLNAAAVIHSPGDVFDTDPRQLLAARGR